MKKSERILNLNKIILASQSPRRKELMELLELDFIVAKSDVDEIFDETLEVHEMAMDLASQKARDVAKFFSDSIVIGFDTIVVYQKHVLGKPKDYEDAKYMLKMLSGTKHQVITGVAIYYRGSVEQFYASTDVVFHEITNDEIDKYIKSNEHLDKAGAYGIQGKAAKFVKEIYGDFYNVMGLPVSSLYQTLKKYEK
jgi:septum formation protein